MRIKGALKSRRFLRKRAAKLRGREDKTRINQYIGVSRGGKSTKIHAIADALGNPIEVMLTAGNIADVTVA